MIGDWVIFKDLKVPVKVCSIMNHYRTSIYFYYNGSELIVQDFQIEPIPLTPEILEKNGFKKYPYKNSYWYCDEMLELFMKIVCIFPIKDRELYSLLSATTPRLTAGEDDVYIRCDYVHELQHTLKLCGIEKEIVL